MKLSLKFTLLLLFTLFSLASMAQEDSISSAIVPEEMPPAPKQYYLLSPRVSVTVPHPTGNASFQKAFVGIYEISAGINLMLYKGFFIGGTYKNGLLNITPNKIADYNAGMLINNAGLKIGIDGYAGDKNRVIASASIAVGQSWTSYTGIKCKDPTRHPMSINYTTTYIEPEVDLFFLVESNFGIGATVTYSVYNHNFDPYELCLDDWAQFDKHNEGLTQYLSFGFGFYYSLLKKKKK